MTTRQILKNTKFTGALATVLLAGTLLLEFKAFAKNLADRASIYAGRGPIGECLSLSVNKANLNTDSRAIGVLFYRESSNCPILKTLPLLLRMDFASQILYNGDLQSKTPKIVGTSRFSYGKLLNCIRLTFNSDVEMSNNLGLVADGVTKYFFCIDLRNN